MDIVLRYFDGCPNWETARVRVLQALNQLGDASVEPVLERVVSDEDAQRLRFSGSPTILLDGRDLFAGSDAHFGLTCRVYITPEGFAGSPTTEQLAAAMVARRTTS